MAYKQFVPRVTMRTVPCQLRVCEAVPALTEQALAELSNTPLQRLADIPHVDTATRDKWAQQLITHADESTSHQLDIILGLDGNLAMLPALGELEKPSPAQYLPHYQIPAANVANLNQDLADHATRQFACGSLLYEIYKSHPPNWDSNSAQVKVLFGEGVFPKDVLDLPGPAFMATLSYWSHSFAEEARVHAEKQGRWSAIENYVKRNPVTTAVQLTGASALAVAFGGLPVLGALGWGTIGPGGGSIAAGLQSSMGLVQAGTWFAWCQSAAMGGAAASAFTTAGWVGASTIVASSIGPLLQTDKAKQEWYDKFVEAFKRDPLGRDPKSKI